MPVLAIIIGLLDSPILDAGEDRCCQLGGVCIAVGSLRSIGNALIVSVEKLGLCCSLVYLDLLITLVDGLLILATTCLESVCVLDEGTKS